MADLKIKMDVDPVTGEKRVPPECFRLLMEMGAHRDICAECSAEMRDGWPKNPCATYRLLLEELLKQPEVQVGQ